MFNTVREMEKFIEKSQEFSELSRAYGVDYPEYIGVSEEVFKSLSQYIKHKTGNYPDVTIDRDGKYISYGGLRYALPR